MLDDEGDDQEELVEAARYCVSKKYLFLCVLGVYNRIFKGSTKSNKGFVGNLPQHGGGLLVEAACWSV